MKKSLKTIMYIMLILIALWAIIFAIDYSKCANLKMPIFVISGETADDGGSGTYYGLGYKVEVKKHLSAEYGVQLESIEMYMFNKCIAGAIADFDNSEENIVIIKNGNINNENLIDNFIDKVSDTSNKEEIVLKIREYTSEDKYEEKELKFIPPSKTNKKQIDENTTIVEIPDSDVMYDEQYGYFTLMTNNDIDTKKTFTPYHWSPKRFVEDDIVKFRFETIGLICVTEFPVICSYSLESSNYTNKFELTYNQRKDLGIKTIIDKNSNSEYEYSTHTFGGDVTITIDGDMVYSLEDALNKKVITAQDILNQAKIDAKYGICQEGYYSDGGSTEYLYENYTILKYNTLDDNKDLVIGSKGQIINKVNDILYK